MSSKQSGDLRIVRQIAVSSWIIMACAAFAVQSNMDLSLFVRNPIDGLGVTITGDLQDLESAKTIELNLGSVLWLLGLLVQLAAVSVYPPNMARIRRFLNGIKNVRGPLQPG